MLGGCFLGSGVPGAEHRGARGPVPRSIFSISRSSPWNLEIDLGLCHLRDSLQMLPGDTQVGSYPAAG